MFCGKGCAVVAKSTIMAPLSQGPLLSVATVPVPLSRVLKQASRFKREAMSVVCLRAKKYAFHRFLTR